MCAGGVESREAQLGTPEWGATRADHCGRYREQGEGETAKSCWRGQKTTYTCKCARNVDTLICKTGDSWNTKV